MAVQTPYVEYIKISRTDELGQDLTFTLEALTQIILPFTNGISTTYRIASTTRYNDYFLFGILKTGASAPLAADAATLDYAYTGSIPTATNSYSFGLIDYTVNTVLLNTPTSDPLGFFNNIEKVYQFDTLPQKDVVLEVNATFFYNDPFVTGPSPRIGAYLVDPSGLYNYTDIVNNPLFQTIYNTSGTHTINETITIPKADITPGHQIRILVTKGSGLAGGITVTFASGNTFKLSSTAASGPTLDTIPEPYLSSQFYGTDCDVLLNNEELYRENPFLQDIDYSGNPFTPVNFNLLLSGSAAKGTVPASYYTSINHAGPRYNGTKNQSLDVNYYRPNSTKSPIDFRFLANTNISSIQDGTQLFDIKNKKAIPIPFGVVELFLGYIPEFPTILTPGFTSFISKPNDADWLTSVTGISKQNSNLTSVPSSPLIESSFNGVYINPIQVRQFENSFENFTINYEVKGDITSVKEPGSAVPFLIGLGLFAYGGSSTSPVLERSLNYTSNDATFFPFPQYFNEGSTNTINVSGTIPTDEINQNKNLLAFTIKGLVMNTTTSLTISNLSIKIWASGLPENIGNFGQTSPITQNDVNIYEYEWGGGTTPEILDWGAVRLGKILQVSSKDLVKTIDASSDIETKIIPQKSNQSSNGSTTARNFRAVINQETGVTQYPDNTANTSIFTSSIYDPTFDPEGSSIDFYRSFWLGPKEISEYSEVLETNNVQNAEISFFPYPNQTNAGSNPTIPITTKVLTTNFCVPGISNYGLTSSYGDFNPPNTSSADLRYGFISSSSPYISLYRDRKISRLKRDSNGFYQASEPIKPNFSTLGNQINEDLNNGERWFVTMYNELEWPNGQGDFNSALTSGSLSPFNIGYTTKDSRGNYPKPFHYKGVWEILGTRDAFSEDIFYILCDENFYVPFNLGPAMNIGGNVPGNSLGMLIWKARDTNKSDFVMVQDSVTGGVGAGAFTSKFAPDYIKDHFEEITREYGNNTSS